jgi:hypothetical protein
MASPAVIATNGFGLPVTISKKSDGTTPMGVPMTVATNGRGTPIVIVAARGMPVYLMNEDGSEYTP